MAVLTFEKITVQDLDQRLIDSIKAYFKNGNVRISITVEKEDKKALLSLDELIEQNRQAPYVARFEADIDFEKLADKVEADETFDVIQVIEKHKIANPNVATRTSSQGH